MIIQILEPSNYSEQALDIYRSLGEVNLGQAIYKAPEVLVIRLAIKFDKQMLDHFDQLKYIVSPTTGLLHIDEQECERRGIKVISLKGEVRWLGNNITSTAEHSWALILSLIRKVPSAFNDVKLDHWNRDGFVGHQLKDKTILLIGGKGRVATQVKKIAKAFQMNVLLSDKGDDLNSLLAQADIISVHVDLNDKTYNLIRGEQLSMMRPSAYLINTSRGEVIDEQDLLMVLNQGKIAGAALDVLWDESSDGKHLKNNMLVEYAKVNDNLILTPHISGASEEAMRLTEVRVAEKLLTIVRNG